MKPLLPAVQPEPDSFARTARAFADDLRRHGPTYLRGLRSSNRHHPRFVVFGRGRSGSSLLVDLLDGLPGVQCDGEILSRRVVAPRLFVRCRESVAPGDAYGFKLLSYQLPFVQRISDGGEFLHRLHVSGYQVIYLKRRNVLRHALSNIYARRKQQFHHRSANGPVGATRMSVAIDELDAWLRNSERWARYEEAALSGLPSLEVVYERDLQRPDDQQTTVDRVAEYLGIPTVPVSTKLTRLTSDDLVGFVSNHEEIEQYIAGTKYRVYLS